MSGYIDVEGMRAAASRMCGAAEDMKSASSWFGDYVGTLRSVLQDHQIAMTTETDRQVKLLAARTELEQMIAHDAGLPDQAGRYAESAYDDLRKRISAL